MSDRDRLGQELVYACRLGRTAEAKRLIAEGAPVDWQDGIGHTPLHSASFNGHTEIVMLLLMHKCNLNVTDENGDTPLILAVLNNTMDIVRALVEAGCDITIRGDNNKTAAEWAKKQGHHTIAEYLTNEAPRVQAEIRADPSRRKALRKQYHSQAEQERRDKLGEQLFRACLNGRTAEAKWLIAEGAPVDWQNELGWAPLHWAYKGYTEIVMLLLETKCNMNITDKLGDTPLIFAAYNNKMDTVRALVEAGCDITIRGNKNKTAAEWAKQEGNDAIAEYLTNEAPRVQARIRAQRRRKTRDDQRLRAEAEAKRRQKAERKRQAEAQAVRARNASLDRARKRSELTRAPAAPVSLPPRPPSQAASNPSADPPQMYTPDQAVALIRGRVGSSELASGADVRELRRKLVQMHSENKLTRSMVDESVVCAKRIRAALSRKQDAVIVPDKIIADRLLHMFYDTLYRELIDAYHVAPVIASSQFLFTESLGLQALRVGQNLPLVGSAVSLISAAVSYHESSKKVAEYGRFRRVADDATSASLLFSLVAHSVTMDARFKSTITNKQACVRAVYKHGLFKATKELWKGCTSGEVRSNAVKLASLIAAQLCQAVFDGKLPLLNRDGIKRDSDEILQQFCMVLCVRPLRRAKAGRAPTDGKSPARKSPAHTNPPTVLVEGSAGANVSINVAQQLAQRLEQMQAALEEQQRRDRERDAEVARLKAESAELKAQLEAKNQTADVFISAGGRGSQGQLQVQRQEQDDRDVSEALRNPGAVTDTQRTPHIEQRVNMTQAELHRLREAVDHNTAKLTEQEDTVWKSRGAHCTCV